MKITSAHDDSTKKYLLDNIDDLKRPDIDELVSQSRPQSKKEPPVDSKIRGMKIKTENKRIVLSFDQKWDETPNDVKKKVEKIAKLIAKMDNTSLDD